MKMYLSSYRLGNKPSKLIELVGTNKRTAVIPNALDIPIDIAERNEGIQREVDDLNKLGFQAEVVDLKIYFYKSSELGKKLAEFGMIWVRGGNVFVLRRAFKESGMDQWLKGQQENKEFVYAGYSAGVCILSPSLKGCDLVDNSNIVTQGYPKKTIWDGLGLIDFAVAPHYKSDHPESEAVNKQVEYFIKNGIKYKTLHDGEVIIINNV